MPITSKEFSRHEKNKDRRLFKPIFKLLFNDTKNKEWIG